MCPKLLPVFIQDLFTDPWDQELVEFFLDLVHLPLDLRQLVALFFRELDFLSLRVLPNPLVDPGEISQDAFPKLSILV